jgi:pantoate--beta-alanine ligase
MKVISTVVRLKEEIAGTRSNPFGFVPTMGALHEGHLSLVRNAIAQCPLIAVSIFVNPTQFNDRKDLKNYPRTIDEDIALLETVMRKDDLLFIPDDIEIYPSGDKRVFDFGNLDKVMEAVHRSGHFNGVAQVVSRLFEIVKPDFAYFGQKDFQQLVIVRALVRQAGLNIKIISNPIIREKDGLAMSSRNRLLEPEKRSAAVIIYKAISNASEMIRNHDIEEIKKYVKETIEKPSGFEVEYFEIVDENELKPVNSFADFEEGVRYYGCVAVNTGKVRLIDNIEIPLIQGKG